MPDAGFTHEESRGPTQGRAQDLYVFAMCGVAYMHARNHDGDLALSLLHQLAPLARSPAAQCYVAVYRAHAFAGLRDHSDAFLALDEAAALSSQAHNDAPSPWLGVPDAMFVQRQRAMIATELGSSEALGLLSTLAEQTPDLFQRYRVTLLNDQALTYARLGDVEQSAHLLAEAVRRNRQVRSAEKAARIQAVQRVLTCTGGGSAVKVLDESLDAAEGTASSPGLPADGW